MPRAARLDHPGAFHHVIARGIERREIFVSDDERAECLDRLSIRVTESGAIHGQRRDAGHPGPADHSSTIPHPSGRFPLPPAGRRSCLARLSYLSSYYRYSDLTRDLALTATTYTPKAVKDAIVAYADAGVDEILFAAADPGIDQIERLAELVP